MDQSLNLIRTQWVWRPLSLFLLFAASWLDPAIVVAQERVIPDIPPRPRVPMYDPGQPVRRQVLKNGVTLLVQERRTSERVTGTVAVRLGTIYETDEESGLSQILMRSIASGTDRWPPVELALRVLAAEAKIESGAGPDFGQISISTHRERVFDAIALLGEITTHPTFPDTAFEGARAYYSGEAAGVADDPIRAAYDAFLKAYYREGPRARPALGFVTSMSKCRRTDIVALHKRFFVGDNLVVAFVGNFEGKKVLSSLAKAFRDVPRGAAPAPVPDSFEPAASDTVVTEDRPYVAYAMVIGYPAPGYGHPDYPAMMMVDSYLRSSDRSPLSFWLPQLGIAAGVGAMYPKYPGQSSIAVHFGAPPTTVDDARDSVLAVMGRLTSIPLDEGEWHAQIKRVQTAFLYEQDNPAIRSRDLTRYEILGLGLDYPTRFETALLALKPEDVRVVAERYFTHYCGALLGPPRRAEAR